MIDKNYRVVQVQQGEKVHYEIERKSFFWWVTETYFDCCIDGLMAGYYPYELKSKEEAILFIENELQEPVKKVV